MKNKCEVSEHISSTWNVIIIACLVVMIVFFLLYTLLDDPLWGGVSRLLAFAGLAGSAVAYLQTRGRVQKIELSRKDKHVVISYFQSTKKNQEELFELPTIAEIKQEPAQPVWHLFPRRNSIKFLISFTDSENTLSMFRIDGRDIYLSSSDARTVTDYINQEIPEANT